VVGEDPCHTWTVVDNPGARSEIDQLVGQLNHRRRLDYVFVGSRHTHPKAECRIHAASLVFDQPIEGIWTSDHLGVNVEIEVNNGDANS
jgi:endonuclease/exonuclease/phosphatase family metal-dependent hydrolase